MTTKAAPRACRMAFLHGCESASLLVSRCRFDQHAQLACVRLLSLSPQRGKSRATLRRSLVPRTKNTGDRPMLKLPGHPRYDYSPIVKRPDYSWPGGKRLAFYIALNIEHFA